MAEAAASTALRLEIADFIAREAELLDERRLDEWLALFTDDARYTLWLRDPPQPGVPRPSQPSDPGEGPGGAVPLFADDRDFLALRVRRLETRLAHAERPPSATRHLLSNVIVEAPDGDEVEVRVNFLVYQARPGLGDQLFFGKRTDRLRQVDGAWRIVRRSVVLDHNPLPRTLTIFF